MSLFIRLSTVVAIVVLLRSVPATVVITAPSTVTDNTAGLETREQGPTAWICSELAVDSPWTSYANIRGYLEGGNAEGKIYSNLVLYPVMELFHGTKVESRLCVYLPAEDHCYPPAPSSNQVKAVKQLTKRHYYAIRFWGQASDARVHYYKQKLTAALNTQSKAANFDLFFVSYFSDHVREVRYDPAPTTAGQNVLPTTGNIVEKESFSCPASSSLSGTATQASDQRFRSMNVNAARLTLTDVQSILVHNLEQHNPCYAVALREGANAYSNVKGVCKLYNFENTFCPCTPGDFVINVNTELLGKSREPLFKAPVSEGLMKIVIYSEMLPGLLTKPAGLAGSTKICETMLLEHPASYMSAIVVGNQCYLAGALDLARCNQSCRGQPFDAFIKRPDPQLNAPILSLCGQKLSASVVPEKNIRTHFFVSHAGHGCYPCPGAKNDEEIDCVVTFEKAANAKSLLFVIDQVALNNNRGTCVDKLLVYNGYSTIPASLLNTSCSAGRLYEQYSVDKAITINFQRNSPSSEMSLGFKLTVESLM